MLNCRVDEVDQVDENLKALAKVWIRANVEQGRRQQYFGQQSPGQFDGPVQTPAGNPFL